MSAVTKRTRFDILRQIRLAAFGTAGKVLADGPGRVFKLTWVNTNSTAYYVQVFDKATAPVNTNIPIWERRLPASSEVTLDFEVWGLWFEDGLSLAVSTTGGVLTLASADQVVAYAQYGSQGEPV